MKDLNINNIKNHIPSIIGLDKIKKASVVIPVIMVKDQAHLLFTVRSSKIDSQPGDICFPGGMIEAGESPQEAAIREICEELLIEESQLEVIGQNDLFMGNSIAIYPYICLLKDYDNTFSSDEVAEIFTVPLSWFDTNKAEYFTVKAHMEMPGDFPYELIFGGREYQWRSRDEQILFYHYGNHHIWGLTAKILESFLTII